MKRALFVIFKKYNGILEGGGIANQRNLTMAQHILGKENVDTIYLHDENKKRSIWNIILSALVFPFGYYNGMTPWKVKDIVKRANDYDYVFLSTSLFGVIAKELKSNNYKGTVIAHFHNVESLYYEHALSKRMPFRKVIIHCAAQNDRYCCMYSDKVLTLNQRDSDMLHKMYGRDADIIVPIAFADKCQQLVPDKESITSTQPLCLFIGSYFPPNVQGIMWFVKDVLPHVNIRLKIVGKGMAKLKENNTLFNDIEIVSDAPDMQPHFIDADFIVLPIFTGSGMKVKTCESLMYGKNILGTDEAFEGYNLDAEKVGGRCNNEKDFINHLNKYIQSPIPRFNSYSRHIYEQFYSEEASVKAFEEVFQ